MAALLVALFIQRDELRQEDLELRQPLGRQLLAATQRQVLQAGQARQMQEAVVRYPAGRAGEMPGSGLIYRHCYA